MKKVYLGFFAGIFSFSVAAQSLQKTVASSTPTSKPSVVSHSQKNDIWTNDFSAPSDWTIQALSGSHNWVIGTTAPGGGFPIGPIQSTTAANGFALFDSDLLCGASGSQNSIVRNTNPIDLSGETNVTLEFQSYYRRFQGTASVGFSTDATNWTFIPVHTDLGVNDGSANPEVVSVPAPVIGNSSTAYICFRYQGGCDYAWMVDDVKIISTPTYDLKTTYSRHHVDMYQYSQIPINQVAPTVFEVGVTNNGIDDLTNVQLTVSVTGQETTSLTSSAISLSAGDIDTLDVSFTPSAVGTYNFSQALSLNETDEDPSNNSNLPNVTFQVTDYVYAVDKGAPYSNYPDLADIFLDATIPRTEIGNSFDIFSNQTVYGVDIRISDLSDEGSELYATLYQINPTASTAAELWTPTGTETDIYVIEPSTPFNTIMTIPFLAPHNLNANTTYMVSVQTIAGDVVYSGSGTTNGNTQSWGIIQNNTGITWTGLSLVPVIRLNFQDPSTVSIDNASKLEGISIYPNPSTGIINISNDTNVENTIVVTDVTGKVISTKVSTAAEAIDLSLAGTGIYIVEVVNENGKKVERVIIK